MSKKLRNPNNSCETRFSLTNTKEKIVKRRKDEILVDTFIYKNIFLTQAIEFVDLIFNNNLDKIYFLRQYLKSFEEKDSYEKAKKFTI